MDQIIKFGISNYLQLCVEAGFSQIQSHIGINSLLILDYSRRPWPDALDLTQDQFLAWPDPVGLSL